MIRPASTVAVLACVIVLGGCGDAGGGAAVTDGPSTTPSPMSLSAAGSDPLPPGRYVIDDPFEPHVKLTIPAKWMVSDYGTGRASLVKRADDGLNAAFVTAYVVSGVHGDPCFRSAADVEPVRDAEDLVAALRAQPGFDNGQLTEGTLDGHRAWTWDVTPTVDVSTCVDDPWLYQWQSPTGSGDATTEYGTIAGAVQRFTVVDLDATPVLFEVGFFETTTEADIAEADAMVESVAFE